MTTFFWVCFGVGVVYTVIAFLLGEVFHFSGFDVHGDFDAGSVSPLKPAVIAAFITVFGGVGVLLYQYASLSVIIAAPVAAIAGTVIAFVIYRFVVVPLSKAQNTSAPEIQSLVGMLAKVTEKIFQGGFGQITYVVNGNTYTSPAKAEDGGEIGRYESVEIIYIQDGTYYVRKK